jgi:hypothetical protein
MGFIKLIFAYLSQTYIHAGVYIYIHTYIFMCVNMYIKYQQNPQPSSYGSTFPATPWRETRPILSHIVPSSERSKVMAWEAMGRLQWGIDAPNGHQIRGKMMLNRWTGV